MSRFAAIAAAVAAIAAPAPAVTSRAAALRMLAEMDALGRFIGTIRVSSYCMGQSTRGQQIPIVVIHDPAVPIDETARLFVICRQHGDEPSSSEASLSIIRTYFAGPSARDVELLRRVTLIIVPMMNPDGALRLTRRNARKVDLNRDWMALTQPETRAVMRAIQDWQPQLILDEHELDPTDRKPDFVESLGRGSGAAQGLLGKTDTLQRLIVASLRAHGIAAASRHDSDRPPPRLAHRYFPLRRGTAALIVESRRFGPPARQIRDRARVHIVSTMTAARCLAGDSAGVQREIGQWRRAREMVRLASRGGGHGSAKPGRRSRYAARKLR